MPASRRREERTDREQKIWLLRQRGYTYEEIAEQVGIHYTGIGRILNRLNTRALADNTDLVAQQKIEQTQILWHTLSQAMRAWEASKEPIQRVRENAAGGTLREVVTREGNVDYLFAVFKSLSDIRSIWGLDVAPQTTDPVQGVGQLIREMQARGYDHEASEAAETPNDTRGVSS